MAAFASIRFIPYTLPPSILLPPNGDTSSQKIRGPAAIHSRTGGRSGAERNVAAKAKDWEHALPNNGDESDDDLPSLEELLRIPPRPMILDKVSRIEPASQRLNQPALKGVGIQVDQTKPGIGKLQGGSPDQPVILDDDDSDEASTEDETEHTERHTSLHSTLETSKCASRPKYTDISGPWYDVEEKRYVDWPAPKFGPRTPRDVSCSLAPDQTKTLSALSIPPQDQIHEQSICDMTPSSFEEFEAHSSNQNPNNSNNEWTEDQEAELEKELRLALVEQGNPLSSSAPNSPRPRLADAPQDNAMTQECIGTIRSRPEQQGEASRLGNPARALKEWKQLEIQVVGETRACWEPRENELVVDRGGVEMQQQEEVRESFTHLSSYAQSKINLSPTTTIKNGHRHTLPQRASPSGPSSPALCGKTGLGNSGEKRGRRDTHREIDSESLRSDDSDDAYDKGDNDLPPTKRRKLYEAPSLIASPRFRRPPSSTSPEIDDTQSQIDDGCPSTFVDNGQYYTSHISRNPSMASQERFSREDEEFDELALDDNLQQGNDTDGSDNFADKDYMHDVGDEDEEDTRPTKQRASFLPRCDKAPRHRHPAASIFTKQLHTPQPSRSPSATKSSSHPAECVPFAEYQEYAINGVFKCITIGNDTTFNLELQVADLPEHFNCTGPLKAMSNTLAAKVSSQAQIPSRRPAISTHHRQRQPPKRQVQPSNQPRTTQRPITSSGVLRKKALPKRRTEWIEEEETTVVNMRKRNASWKEISVAVPSHSLGSITGHYYGTLRKRT